jgi:hypothetical protein
LFLRATSNDTHCGSRDAKYSNRHSDKNATPSDFDPGVIVLIGVLISGHALGFRHVYLSGLGEKKKSFFSEEAREDGLPITG